ncbi:DUF302 domain-containing protein [Saccharicrinis sp. FJH2]|uniref:DUF302 domain-containing protein n=1 Tax=unclassified Saccharicrinis TaxID=2646859 RepID=UPI0035D4EF88
MNYYYSKTVDYSFEDTIEKLKAELKPEGFGIVTEMDVQEKFHEKLDVYFRPYRILGACNPKFAYEALQEDDKLGTMLPCNFIVQRLDNEKTEIAAINPVASMQAIDNAKLNTFAIEVGDILKRVLDKV